MDTLIALDIGGTRMRAARFALGAHTPQEIRKIPTQISGSTPEESLFHLVESVWPPRGAVRAIAAALPGPVDFQQGVLLTAPNIPQWRGYPLPARLEARFGVPAAMDNDANLAALGEWRFGAGRGHHYLLYLTISTGIGGGVILDDRILHGERGLAGELGHLTVLPDGPLCGCGQRGHLEAVASGTAIARQARAALKSGIPSKLSLHPPPTAKQIAEAAAQGDTLARELLAQAGYYIGVALADYLHIFNPTCLVIGGGVSRSGDLLLGPLRAAMQAHVMSPEYLKNLTVTTATLGDNAGLMGALALAERTVLEKPAAP
jgi:glucokinase